MMDSRRFSLKSTLKIIDWLFGMACAIVLVAFIALAI